ncbi:hypothetical protein DL93DRAFT_244496 [Clavulina sp. PMI_390]|nr:hypothetical protein DL93DRAFT_244496 [Clavulina sp. PMI_390]
MDPMWDPFAFPPQVPIELSLKNLCNTIDSNSAMQNARIISMAGYRQSGSHPTHRFVVLQLRQEGGDGRNIWMRLDRRRGAGVSRFKFVLMSSGTKANDLAKLCADHTQLVEQADPLEYYKTLPDLPPLGDFSKFLRIMLEELLQYHIWPDNCWFFCSIIEQHLVSLVLSPGSNYEWFAAAGLDIKHLDMGNDYRERIFARYWANPFTPPFPLTPEKLQLWEQSWNPPLKISASGPSIEKKVMCMAGPFDPAFESIRAITIRTIS